MFNVNFESLKNTGKKLMEFADRFGMSSDNLIWACGLDYKEQIMLIDFEMEFKAKKLNVDEKSLVDMRRVYNEYNSVLDFYTSKIGGANLYRNNRALGFEMRTPYDPNLTITEAFTKYLGCSQEEAKKIHDLYSDVDYEYQKYLTELRMNYTGSLAQLIGKNDEEYAKKAAADVKEYLSKLENLKEEFSSYGEYVNGITISKLDEPEKINSISGNKTR